MGPVRALSAICVKLAALNSGRAGDQPGYCVTSIHNCGLLSLCACSTSAYCKYAATYQASPLRVALIVHSTQRAHMRCHAPPHARQSAVRSTLFCKDNASVASGTARHQHVPQTRAQPSAPGPQCVDSTHLITSICPWLGAPSTQCAASAHTLILNEVFNLSRMPVQCTGRRYHVACPIRV